MPKNSLFFICLFLMTASVGAQTLFSKKLDGRVQSKDGDVAATHVLNTTTQRATITDSNGFFSIPANVGDTLIFSAVQFKRKVLVVSMAMLNSKLISVPLEDALTQLDEVVVTPYNLTGDMNRDIFRIAIEPVVTASTLGLPNAYVKVPTMAERQLYEATSGGGIIPLFPIINAITGRTKMLKKRIARNQKYARTLRVREMYADSLFRIDFKIPEEKIDEFMYFCELDSTFQAKVDTHDRFKIWDHMRELSLDFHKNSEEVDKHK